MATWGKKFVSNRGGTCIRCNLPYEEGTEIHCEQITKKIVHATCMQEILFGGLTGEGAAPAQTVTKHEQAPTINLDNYATKEALEKAKEHLDGVRTQNNDLRIELRASQRTVVNIEKSFLERFAKIEQQLAKIEQQLANPL